MGRNLGRWIAARLTGESRPGFSIDPITIYEKGPNDPGEGMEYEQANAAEWFLFRGANSGENNLGHPPGCDCRWCP
jgi:hypothetical protein